MDFKQSYSREKFTLFLREFLPDDYEASVEVLQKENSFKFIKEVTKLGNCKSLNLNIYEVDHNSENDPRVTLSKEAFRLMRKYAANRSLVIFKNSKTSNYRFSLITFQTSWDSGKKIKTEFSNPRRYSFYLGPEAKTKTPENFLIKRGKIKDFNDLLSRFDVEVVTKEFYQNYRKLFERLTEYFRQDHAFNNFADKNNIDISDFAKKLLGQIVFLYFLQRKGWLGASKEESIENGDKNFLRNLFIQSQTNNDNFFNGYLEPLFYNSLNQKPPYAATFYRDRFKCQIPFLNGGLFEPLNNYDWQRSFIQIPNKMFSNKTTNNEGTGILDIFDLYNFTIAEDGPTDQEVSIDPEMLGKVFENLLEENLRKGKGTYYTPREIVHYMCEQSIFQYLSTQTKIKVKDLKKAFNVLEDKGSAGLYEGEALELDRALERVKIVDPACGSGAFLVGTLQEIVRMRLMLRMYHPKALSKKSIYALKNEAIENCIFGVDIDPGAVEIAKLRLWLSLVVDFNLRDIEPLPNLDYKIMQGNSLLEDLIVGDNAIKLYDPDINGDKLTEMKNLLDKDLQNDLFGEKEEAKKLANQLTDLQNEYFSMTDHKAKLKRRLEIEKLELNLIRHTVNREKQKLENELSNIGKNLITISGVKEQDAKKYSDNLKKQADLMKIVEEIERKKVKPYFLWRLHFAEIFSGNNPGFDVVIANPPYVKEYVNRSAFDGLRSSPYYQGKMDLWYLFACKGIDVSKNDSGIVTFIAQNNWVTSYGASKMRNKVVKDAQILSLIDFGNFKIFEAGIQTMVMMFKKNTGLDSYSFDYRRLHGNGLELKDVVFLLNKESGIKAEYLSPTIKRSDFIDRTLTFSSSDVDSILEKISSKANIYLDPKRKVAQGIVCPQDYVNKTSQKVLGANFRVGEGIFILSENELKALNLSKKELALVKPLYTTDELNRWWGNTENKKWIIYTDSSFKNKKKIEEYPNIKKHLNQFRKVITSDNKPYGLHRARDEYFFKGEKIIAVRKCARPTFTYTDFDSYVTATFYVIKTKRVDQQYLTGLLNSKLITFWLKHKGKMQGTNYQIDKEPIIDLPIVKADQTSQNAIANIVSKLIDILGSKSRTEKQAKVRDYENQIDQMVYKLYRLTKKEIKAVEGLIN